MDCLDIIVGLRKTAGDLEAKCQSPGRILKHSWTADRNTGSKGYSEESPDGNSILLEIGGKSDICYKMVKNLAESLAVF